MQGLKLKSFFSPKLCKSNKVNFSPRPNKWLQGGEQSGLRSCQRETNNQNTWGATRGPSTGCDCQSCRSANSEDYLEGRTGGQEIIYMVFLLAPVQHISPVQMWWDFHIFQFANLYSHKVGVSFQRVILVVFVIVEISSDQSRGILNI